MLLMVCSMGDVWVIREEATTKCPGLDLTAIPDYAFDILKVAIRSGVPEVTVEGYVGTIPLTGGGAIQIAPKYGASSYLEMLLGVRGVYQPRHFQEQREISDGNHTTRTGQDILATSFAKAVATVLSSGFRTERRTREVCDTFARGQISVLPTAMALSGRSSRPVVSQESYPTTRLIEHFVIAEAARVALPHVSDADFGARQALQRWLRLYPDRASLSDIADTGRKLASGRFSRSRGYYAPAVSLALALLGFAGLSDEGQRLARDCVVVHMPTLFESYVRTTLSLALSSSGYSIVKGGSPGNEFLYIDGRFELEPDLCIYKGAAIAGLGDVKYKRPSATDHYQLLSYMRAYGVDSGFFITPVRGNGEIISEYQTSDRLRVRELQVDLSDLSRVSIKLAEVRSTFAR